MNEENQLDHKAPIV